MQPLSTLIALFAFRAHIPDPRRCQTGPEMPYARMLLRSAVAFLAVVAFLSILLWLAVRLAIGLL
jgi:hypothetical protein